MLKSVVLNVLLPSESWVKLSWIFFTMCCWFVLGDVVMTVSLKHRRWRKKDLVRNDWRVVATVSGRSRLRLWGRWAVHAAADGGFGRFGGGNLRRRFVWGSSPLERSGREDGEFAVGGKRKGNGSWVVRVEWGFVFIIFSFSLFFSSVVRWRVCVSGLERKER